jgi:hypothetical protein
MKGGGVDFSLSAELVAVKGSLDYWLQVCNEGETKLYQCLVLEL